MFAKLHYETLCICFFGPLNINVSQQVFVKWFWYNLILLYFRSLMSIQGIQYTRGRHTLWRMKWLVQGKEGTESLRNDPLRKWVGTFQYWTFWVWKGCGTLCFPIDHSTVNSVPLWTLADGLNATVLVFQEQGGRTLRNLSLLQFETHGPRYGPRQTTSALRWNPMLAWIW